MPVKSFREMSSLERKRYSLEARVFNTIVIYSIVLALICFVIGMTAYMNAILHSSMEGTAEEAEASIAAAQEVSDPVSYAERVMEIYKVHISEPDGDAYYDAFRSIGEEPEYKQMKDAFIANRAEDVSDFFYGICDRENRTVVFVVDTDPRPDHVYPIGRRLKLPRLLLSFFFREGKTEFPKLFYYIPKRGMYCLSGAYCVPGDLESGFVLIAMKPIVAMPNLGSFALTYVIAVLVSLLLVGYLLAQRIKKAVVKPINEIADAARNYVNDRKEGKTYTDHFALLNIHTGDEIENLSLVMADMERDLDGYVEDLTAATAEKERVGAELDMAAKIQAAMLPHVFPPFPDRNEFELYATMEPAKEVGGDFYDFFLIDDDHLCMVMADVSGKGVPAALFMMISKVILQSCAMLGKSASEILTMTNQALCKDNQVDMFVTVWLGILEISTGKMTMANAGHEYPVFRKSRDAFELLKDEHGFVLGGFDDEIYWSQEIYLEPGTKIFLYTDGVPEAMDAKREQFGLDRMMDALNADPAANPEDLLKNVRTAVRDFVKDAEQFDDITMLCLEYKGSDKKVEE